MEREKLPLPGTIAGQFLSYRYIAMHEKSPEIQVTECRRAFYAGAKAFKYLLEIGPDDDKELELYISRLNDELDAFLIQLMKNER